MHSPPIALFAEHLHPHLVATANVFVAEEVVREQTASTRRATSARGGLRQPQRRTGARREQQRSSQHSAPPASQHICGRHICRHRRPLRVHLVVCNERGVSPEHGLHLVVGLRHDRPRVPPPGEISCLSCLFPSGADDSSRATVKVRRSGELERRGFPISVGVEHQPGSWHTVSSGVARVRRCPSRGGLRVGQGL